MSTPRAIQTRIRFADDTKAQPQRRHQRASGFLRSGWDGLTRFMREAQAKGLVSCEGIAQETVRMAQGNENRRKRWEQTARRTVRFRTIRGLTALHRKDQIHLKHDVLRG